MKKTKSMRLAVLAAGPFGLLHFHGSGLRPEQRAAGGNAPGGN